MARPERPLVEAMATGLQPLQMEVTRDGFLYVPTSYRVDHPAPLVLLFHGAGADAQNILRPLVPVAEAMGVLLLAPDSREQSWDIIMSQYGTDITFIDEALAQTFRRYAVDPAHLAAGGFSDGASYALSVGLTNGDVFTHIIAFSPGFMAPARREGHPLIYISHGTYDQVLPIHRTSQRIVPELRREGYDVTYHEFQGPHTFTSEIAREAFTWFTRTTDEGAR